jgi:uncharacterized protein (DUF924 family)
MDILRHLPAGAGNSCRGEPDSWTEAPCGRLALIIVPDQFSRMVIQPGPWGASGV